MIDWIIIALFGSGDNEDRKLKIVPKPIPTYSNEIVIDTPPAIEDRLTNLANVAGVTVPVSQGFCSHKPTVLGCYNPNNRQIIITDSGMARSDEKIICVLKHEMRHLWQDDNGLIKFDAKGNITNKEWIEKDARENGCK